MTMTTKAKVIVEQESESDSNSGEVSDKEVGDISENHSEDMDVDDKDDVMENFGWADSIAKILKANKPKGKRTLVLSKAKKLTDVHKAKAKKVTFEVQTEDGLIKQEEIEESDSVEEHKKEEPLHKKRKELPVLRVKPNILEKDRERTLAKIATKGVVQLFNAVKKQQKDIDTKLRDAGPLEVKRDKALKSIDKREFLNVLMGEKSQTVKSQGTEKITRKNKTTVAKEEPTWSILRDDFMINAKMKDWDKETEEENEQEGELVESE